MLVLGEKYEKNMQMHSVDFENVLQSSKKALRAVCARVDKCASFARSST